MADPVRIWSAKDCKKYLPLPKDTDHKYKRGVLGCLTGSNQYPGAALLTTSSAQATGIGMVRYIGPRGVRREVILNRPEVVIERGKVDALLMGSGISDSRGLMNLYRRLQLSRVNRLRAPKVLDAGALYLVKNINAPTIITPHVGELAKLLNINSELIASDPNKYAKLAAEEFHVTVLLKGHESVVANVDRLIKLPAATSWLASAGTGDVLAGILGALISINKNEVNDQNLIEIGATASFIHSQAASITSNGPINLNEMIRNISKVVTQLTI